MGREISQVMGHLGAAWLERAEREQQEKPEKVLDSLGLRPGLVVADIGAGSGYFTRRLSQRVGSGGSVFAVDIQPQMLELLESRLRKEGVNNVSLVLGIEQDPRLPDESIDLALMVDVYHEFSYPYEMLRALCQALKPGGRVAFVEYKAEDPWIPIKPLHKMSAEQIRREASLHPLREVLHYRDLERQHVLIFERVEG
jgi:ubiquinone/menaquinone biosynthesis C-methylase UbiE